MLKNTKFGKVGSSEVKEFISIIYEDKEYFAPIDSETRRILGVLDLETKELNNDLMLLEIEEIDIIDLIVEKRIQVKLQKEKNIEDLKYEIENLFNKISKVDERPRTHKEFKHLMPAGKYYIGDPCYIISKDDCGWWLNYVDIILSRNYDGLAKLDGITAWSSETNYGDGCYLSNEEDQKYYVDSGTIGIVRLDDIGDHIVINWDKINNPENYYQIKDFTEPFEVKTSVETFIDEEDNEEYDVKYFHIGDIIIET
jgi:predicted DNA-binding WGR domain protein